MNTHTQGNFATTVSKEEGNTMSDQIDEFAGFNEAVVISSTWYKDPKILAEFMVFYNTLVNAMVIKMRVSDGKGLFEGTKVVNFNVFMDMSLWDKALEIVGKHTVKGITFKETGATGLINGLMQSRLKAWQLKSGYVTPKGVEKEFWPTAYFKDSKGDNYKLTKDEFDKPDLVPSQTRKGNVSKNSKDVLNVLADELGDTKTKASGVFDDVK